MLFERLHKKLPDKKRTKKAYMSGWYEVVRLLLGREMNTIEAKIALKFNTRGVEHKEHETLLANLIRSSTRNCLEESIVDFPTCLAGKEPGRALVNLRDLVKENPNWSSNY